MARRLLWLALATACGPGAPPPHVTLTSPTPRDAPRALLELAPDFLRCPLEVSTFELGEKGDGAPSAPVATPDGIIVAFNHGSNVMTQRLDAAGVLHDAVVLGNTHGATPLLVADHGKPRTAEGALPDVGPNIWPDALAMGPRGLVATFLRGATRVVVRGGREIAIFPETGPYPMMAEEVLASGPAVDVVVLRQPTLRVGVVPASGASVMHPLRTNPFAEVSIAAGPSGYLVVGDGPALTHLTVFPLDRTGAPSAPVEVPSPGDSEVTRFPRAAAVEGGWVVTYWDGIGPSVVRIDGAGREASSPIALRSGDERGGQTEARIAVTSRAIVVTWVVGTPWFSHGVAAEIPDRPGPRLAVLSCR